MPAAASKPVSEKQLAANRLNAQKSTGPKSDEGKNRSKFNALQHGMRAATTVLPTEDASAFDQRLEDWNDELQPDGEFEAYLVKLAVESSWRLDRCRRTETARLEKNLRDAREIAAREAEERTRTLIEALPDSPFKVAAALRESSGGVTWLIERFEWLKDVLECRGYWEPSEKDYALNLLGKSPSQIFLDTEVIDISQAFLNSGWIEENDAQEVGDLLSLDTYPPRGMKLKEIYRRLDGFLAARAAEIEKKRSEGVAFDPVGRGKDELLVILNQELRQLHQTLTRLKAKEAMDWNEEELERLGGCDLSLSGQALTRYEASQRRAFHSALRDLANQRKANGSASPEAVEPETVAPNEPNLDLDLETQARLDSELANFKRSFGRSMMCARRKKANQRVDQAKPVSGESSVANKLL